jgi:hypothetical protein
MKEIKKARYQAYLTLTGEESFKLQELSRQLKLTKSETIGLLITRAQIVETSARKTKLVDESLVIQEG